MIRSNILEPNYNSLFPYEIFPWRLEHETTICWFECQEHLDKYLERYKLDKRTIKIDYRDGESVEPSKKRKRSVEQKPGKKSKGSTGAVRKRKSSVDSVGNTTRNTRKGKK